MDDKTATLIRALEASGSEREANLARAILGDPAAPAPAAPPAAPEIPATPVPAAAVEAATSATGPTPPPGKAPLQNLDEWEALPHDEQLARMDEVDYLLGRGAK